MADFVDFIQTLANARAVNGGTMSCLNYAERILEENEINLGAAASRIMDTDMAYESTKMARQNVLLQAAASMVTQANALNNAVLSLSSNPGRTKTNPLKFSNRTNNQVTTLPPRDPMSKSTKDRFVCSNRLLKRNKVSPPHQTGGGTLPSFLLRLDAQHA